MNSDFVASRARALAETLLAQEGLTDRKRIDRAYWTILSRPAEPEEASRMLAYVRGYPGSEHGENHLDAWGSLCRVMLVSNEFHYVN